MRRASLADDRPGRIMTRSAISIAMSGRTSMKILRSSARKTNRAPASNFTGVVFSDEVVAGTSPSRMRASVVSFTPGARTAWHSHPVGQTLFCLSGAGRVQREGENVQEIRAGDTVIIPPDVRHWHGAAPDKLFSHLAMSELNDKGEGTAWFEHVSDEAYNATPASVT
jgi:quercetin dioxygenase-like cupin family protein